jgi:predicted nucleic acid-binding Zn ribbon protein
MERIPQHDHCQICGKAIPTGETVCSDECREEYQAFVKKRKTYMYVMYGALAVLVVMFILFLLG